MLTVGTDTYISLEDAETYVVTHLLSDDPKRVKWATLTDDDKEVLLRKATLRIDETPLQGVKVLFTQTLEFPRVLFSSALLEGYVQESVPAEVQNAEVEIALQLAVGESARDVARREGVSSYSIGHLSETLRDRSAVLKTLVSEEAETLLRPYLANGVTIV